MEKEKKKRYLWGILYMVVLAAFTAYVLLDTFCIPRAYTPVATAPKATQASKPTTEPTEGTADTQPVITGNSYSDGNISIVLTEHRYLNTAVYVAEIRLTDPDYLKTALAKDTYGKNIKQTTSDMAAEHGAILAVNGDYYGARERGYVLRNGVLYREAGDDRSDLVIWEDGSLAVIREKDHSAQSLLDRGARQVLSFGPGLVMDGQIAVRKDQEVGQASASNPRTAIGQIDPLHYLLVVSDGRTDESEGLTLYQLSELLVSLGAKTAYNLDGGGSSTMYFNGRIVNNPVSHGSTVSERKVSDIVYIGY